MAKYVAALLLLVVCIAAGCSGRSGGSAPPPPPTARGAVPVAIGYLNHPPVRQAVDQVDQLLARYGDKLQVSRYDLDTAEGKAFAKRVNLTVHSPLVIYINGTMEIAGKDGRQVKLFSFPAGLGSGATPGSGWSMADLEAALERATGGKP